MPRPFTRAQAQQNRQFLVSLARTGNTRLTARELGVHRATYTKRRARDPAFATEWDGALAGAHAAFTLTGGTRPPEFGVRTEARRRGAAEAATTPLLPESGRTRGRAKLACDQPASPGRTDAVIRTPSSASPRLRANQDFRTKGGEPTVTRTRNGRLQLRLALPGRLTGAGEQAFLRALSASANIHLSAAAAGFAHSTFYKRRDASRAFARELMLALETGYDRIEAAALQAALPDSGRDDAWRRNDLPPIPPMTPDQALQLLYLHEKSVRQSWSKPHRRRRRTESEEAYIERLRAMWTTEKEREEDRAAIRRIDFYELHRDDPSPDEPAPPPLPALEQVTGWSKADPAKRKHNPDKALFGGWRLDDVEKQKT